MQTTTTVRVSRKTKERFERISSLTGLSLSKTLDFAAQSAEERIDRYHGDVDSLLGLRTEDSGYKNTSKRVDVAVAQALKTRR